MTFTLERKHEGFEKIFSFRMDFLAVEIHVAIQKSPGHPIELTEYIAIFLCDFKHQILEFDCHRLV